MRRAKERGEVFFSLVIDGHDSLADPELGVLARVVCGPAFLL